VIWYSPAATAIDFEDVGAPRLKIKLNVYAVLAARAPGAKPGVRFEAQPRSCK
jgi:hypothetical protein